MSHNHKPRMSFEEACRRYVHRYTVDHFPQWAKKPVVPEGMGRIRFYAPQWRSDREWYEYHLFPPHNPFSKTSCHATRVPTFPMGLWLSDPWDEVVERREKVLRAHDTGKGKGGEIDG